ncbi:GNAT family N-acetyltransferase [Caminibacter mediatlanticus TB-2]|uniref:GNAT family N-acetyltransferase n=1 Tax=Caminibacter mediatlanticus TB-2 TaxID=391592 RepID=A0ABX5V8F7_9BACT|nr:GNAT family N-acetyltransferase [Caminibacter mediatlanticus]QCT94563.1 GNAT family N-acetyltransferase [Caminibacter mediatlanticus TB-2]
MKGHIGISSPFFIVKEKLPALIRDIKKEDAKDITELFKLNYEDTYYKKSFYNPSTWEEMVESKKYYPVVAEVNGKVIGQFLLTVNDKYNGEIGAVVVHPNFKGRGLMNQMFDYLIQKAKSLGLYAIYGEAIMFHPFSQKANLKHGMIESALQLGEVASWIAQKDIKFEKRSATLVSYLLFKKEKRSLYLPEVYKKVILDRYKKLNIPLSKTVIRPVKKSLKLWENRLLKLSGLIIDGKIKNFENRFNTLFAKAKLRGEMVYADINLHTKEIDEIVSFLNKKRFFYSGVLFYRYNGFDYLRLQYENTHNVEEKLNVCFSDYCKWLSKFVREDKKRVYRL